MFNAVQDANQGECDSPLKRPGRRVTLESFGAPAEDGLSLNLRKNKSSLNSGGSGLRQVTNECRVRDENIMSGIDTGLRGNNSDREIETPCLTGSGVRVELDTPMTFAQESVEENSPDSVVLKKKRKGKASGFNISPGRENLDNSFGNTPEKKEDEYLGFKGNSLIKKEINFSEMKEDLPTKYLGPEK